VLLTQLPGGRCVELSFHPGVDGACDLQEGKLYFRVLSHAYGAWDAWTDCVVIRIRYKDFSAGAHDRAGLHGKAEGCARAATVYLLPGLTAWQRRAVIRRLRQEASRGFGPPLRQPQLAIAIGVDRVRTAARVVTAIVRLHPAVTLLPSAFVVAMMTLFVIAAGERPGITSETRGGLADAAAVSGSTARTAVSGSTARTESAERARAWVAKATVGEGFGGVDAGTWYVCPPVVTATAWPPLDGQLACHRLAPRAAPPTVHLPAPLDFAW
jgi:hypothetical protein